MIYETTINDPLNLIDPSGLCPWCLIGAVVGGGIDLAAQLYNNGGHLSQVDYLQTAAAAGVGALTGGASAFIGGAIEGGGALALAGRAAANGVVGSAGTVGQTAVLNNVAGHNDSYQTSAIVGGVFGAAGSITGDALTAGIQAVTPRPNVSPGYVNFANNLAAMNNINVTSAGVVAEQALGAVVGGGASFVPLENEAPRLK